MQKREFKKISPYICIAALCLIPTALSAFVASSTNYRIQFDSVNVGGVLGSSTEYKIEDTMGEIATGHSSSTNYNLYAGYQQMNETYLSVSFSNASVSLSPAIGGLTGGTATGSVAATVITDNAAGYSLYLKASSSPAMQSGLYSFADYATAIVGVPDYDWLISSNDSEFGFTPEGSHIIQKYKDESGVCNSGSGDTANSCWSGFLTTDELVSLSYSPSSGAETIIKFQAESGANHFQQKGTYQATITATALAN